MDFTEDLENGRNSLNLSNKVLGAGIYFTLFWIIVNYAMYGLSATLAWKLGYTPWFSIDGLSSLAGTEGWRARYIAIVFALPPSMAMVLSIASRIAFNWVSPFRTHIRTGLFWFSIATFVFHYGHILSGLGYLASEIPKLFTGYVALYTWMRLEPETITIILVLQAIFSISWILVYVPLIFRLGYSRKLLRSNSTKMKVFWPTFFWPCAVAFMLSAVATLPLNFYQFLTQWVVCLIVVGVSFAGFHMFNAPNTQVVKGGLANRSNAYYFLLVVLIIAVARLLLSKPVFPY
mgnify:CR=1 FL=1